MSRPLRWIPEDGALVEVTRFHAFSKEMRRALCAARLAGT